MLAVPHMLISEKRSFCGLVLTPPRPVLYRVETYCSSRNRMWILTVLDLQ